MRTECKQVRFEFHQLSQRKVKARFDGGKITSDAGVLLLREVEQRTGLVAGLTACFRDHRDPRLIEHTVEELLGQRIYGLCLGYEDLNDHDQLRTDPMLAVAVNKADPLGERRRQASDRGKALAGRCTLNRLELTGAEVDEQERYKKIAMDPDRSDCLGDGTGSRSRGHADHGEDPDGSGREGGTSAAGGTRHRRGGGRQGVSQHAADGGPGCGGTAQLCERTEAREATLARRPAGAGSGVCESAAHPGRARAAAAAATRRAAGATLCASVRERRDETTACPGT